LAHDLVDRHASELIGQDIHAQRRAIANFVERSNETHKVEGTVAREEPTRLRLLRQIRFWLSRRIIELDTHDPIAGDPPEILEAGIAPEEVPAIDQDPAIASVSAPYDLECTHQIRNAPTRQELEVCQDSVFSCPEASNQGSGVCLKVCFQALPACHLNAALSACNWTSEST
jgi:hypothetical protein